MPALIERSDEPSYHRHSASAQETALIAIHTNLMSFGIAAPVCPTASKGRRGSTQSPAMRPIGRRQRRLRQLSAVQRERAGRLSNQVQHPSGYWVSMHEQPADELGPVIVIHFAEEEIP